MAHSVIEGNLGADPELRYTGDGKPVASLRVAWTERVKTNDGWTTSEPVWVRVNVWGESSTQAVVSSLRKGDRILAIGDLVQQSYLSRDQDIVRYFEMRSATVAVPLRFHRVDLHPLADQPTSGWNPAPQQQPQAAGERSGWHRETPPRGRSEPEVPF